MGREAANDPRSAQLHKRIGIANRHVQNLLIQDSASLFAQRPLGRRWCQGLGLASDAGAVTVRDRNYTHLPQASKPGHAAYHRIRVTSFRHQTLDRLANARWNTTAEFRQSVQLLPEMHWVAEFIERNLPQPGMLLLEHEGAPALDERLAEAVQNGGASILGGHCQMALGHGQDSTGSQPNQIDGVGQDCGLVKVVDTPHQATLKVAPGSEILDVEVAHCEHRGGRSQVGTDLRPELHPAIEGGSKESEWRLGHAFVLEAKIRFNDWDVVTQPFFETVCGFDDVHGTFPDRGASLQKANGFHACK